MSQLQTVNGREKIMGLCESDRSPVIVWHIE